MRVGGTNIYMQFWTCHAWILRCILCRTVNTKSQTLADYKLGVTDCTVSSREPYSELKELPNDKETSNERNKIE